MSARRLTATELFDVIDEQDAADEAERILALGDAALDRALKADGLDPATERERGRREGARARGGAGAPRRVVTMRRVSLLAAALAAVVVVALAIAPVLRHRSHRGEIGPDPEWMALPSPREVRRRALAACDEERWTECLAGLDAARDRDPRGDADDRVVSARAAASAALAPPPPVNTGPRREDKPHEDKPHVH